MSDLTIRIRAEVQESRRVVQVLSGVQTSLEGLGQLSPQDVLAGFQALNETLAENHLKARAEMSIFAKAAQRVAATLGFARHQTFDITITLREREDTVRVGVRIQTEHQTLGRLSRQAMVAVSMAINRELMQRHLAAFALGQLQEMAGAVDSSTGTDRTSASTSAQAEVLAKLRKRGSGPPNLN